MSTSDTQFSDRIWSAINTKTKPPGSLGRLEQLAHQIAMIQRSEHPSAERASLLLFAGDHGLVAEGVSAWPSEVTGQMVLNFLSGGAAANVFARQHGVNMRIVDAGIVSDIGEHTDLVRANIRKGTRNAALEDALSAGEVNEALDFGKRMAIEEIENKDAQVIALGEMGIGNTSSAALIAHAIANIPLATLTGPGAGLDKVGVSHKLTVLQKAADRKRQPLSPVDALAAFGGLEIVMMTGAMLASAERNCVLLIDGFIASAAAVAAVSIAPKSRDAMIFAHRSQEPGHQAILEHLSAMPLLDLEMRLGEGSGALLALPLLRSACAMLNEMATFESAGISEKSGD